MCIPWDRNCISCSKRKRDNCVLRIIFTSWCNSKYSDYITGATARQAPVCELYWADQTPPRPQERKYPAECTNKTGHCGQTSLTSWPNLKNRSSPEGFKAGTVSVTLSTWPTRRETNHRASVLPVHNTLQQPWPNAHSKQGLHEQLVVAVLMQP